MVGRIGSVEGLLELTTCCQGSNLVSIWNWNWIWNWIWNRILFNSLRFSCRFWSILLTLKVSLRRRTPSTSSWASSIWTSTTYASTSLSGGWSPSTSCGLISICLWPTFIVSVSISLTVNWNKIKFCSKCCYSRLDLCTFWNFLFFIWLIYLF